MSYMRNYQLWCTDETFDEATRAELKALAGNQKEIEDRFYRDLEFGTGGLRGVIGAGTNRMNIYTVRRASQGLANYIKQQHGESRGVAIAFDSRRMSPEFSEEAALCLNANGIKTYRFETLRPTPELSFSLRELGCIAGIVVTASHNPPEYNGYKVYWEDGAQITSPVDKEIIHLVNSITDYSSLKTMGKEDAIAAGLYHIIGEDIDKKYVGELKKLVLDWDAIRTAANDLKIVYTPLHGTGNIPVQRVLRELGFKHVFVVPEQEKPDGNFPTVSNPNPESPDAFALGLNYAKEQDADLVLATDPDADRLGIYAKDSKSGEYIPFTGNMSGMLICEYQLSRKRELGLMPKNGALVSTIVSTNMAHPVADHYNLRLVETLTGFKYIGEQIKIFEQTGCNTYLFGFEESYGCLVGTHARDKDAIVAVMALCEAAAYYKSKNMTLWDQMLTLYEKYGYYQETQKAVTFKGSEGAAKIASILEELRQNPPKKLGGFQVLEYRDYSTGTVLNMETGTVSSTGLPYSNVLYFVLEGDNWFCVRPSGTEPKIKYYMGVKGDSVEDAGAKLQMLRNALD